MIRENLKYINHVNEEFDLSANGVWVEESDLHDYNWKMLLKNRRIAAFYRDVTTRKLPVVIVCATAEEGLAIRNRLFEVAEKDVLANRYGRLVCGAYHLRCFITGSEKSSYLISPRHMRTALSVTTDLPVWVRETSYTFLPAAAAARTLDHSFDYPFDWHSAMDSDQMINTGFTACAFRMVVYGPVTSPAVYVNGHEYKVNCTVGANEYLTIDSADKTIYRTINDGTQINHFADRSREQYIFRPIPPGRCTVTWDEGFKVDIVLLEERGEPKWT